MTVSSSLPPVLILGGEANALSVVRDLGRQGITVYAMGEADSSVQSSRYCNWLEVEIDGTVEESWARFLLSERSDYLRGAGLLSCSDAGLQVLIRHREKFAAHYMMDDSTREWPLPPREKM